MSKLSADRTDKELKYVLVKRGYHFHTDTDIEVVAVLCKYVWDSQPHKRMNFTGLIKTVVKELVSLESRAFADRCRKDRSLSSSSRSTSPTKLSLPDEDLLCSSVSRLTEN